MFNALCESQGVYHATWLSSYYVYKRCLIVNFPSFFSKGKGAVSNIVGMWVFHSSRVPKHLGSKSLQASWEGFSDLIFPSHFSKLDGRHKSLPGCFKKHGTPFQKNLPTCFWLRPASPGRTTLGSVTWSLRKPSFGGGWYGKNWGPPKKMALRKNKGSKNNWGK